MEQRKVGQFLKRLRSETGLTQAQLATGLVYASRYIVKLKAARERLMKGRKG